MSRFARLTKELMLVGLGQAVAVVGSLVAVRVLTNYLSPEIYGEVALTLTFSIFAQQIFLGPCVSTLARFYGSSHEANQMGAYYAAGYRMLKLASVCVTILAGVLAAFLLASGYTKYFLLTFVALIFAGVSGYSAAMDGIQNAARERTIVALHQGLSQWLRLAGVVLVVVCWGVSSLNALWGYTLGVSVVMISQSIFLSRKIGSDVGSNWPQKTTQSDELYSKMYTYAWPFAVWGILGWIQFSADRWALQIGGTAQEVGFYAVLYQLGVSPMLLISGVLMQLVAPILFQRVGAGDNPERVLKMLQLNQRLCYCSLIITAIGSVATVILHEQIFAWLVAPTYRMVSYLLPWMAMSGGLFASAQLATLSLLSDGTSSVLLAPKIGCAILAAILYFSLVWKYGLVGVVMGGLLVSVVYLVWILRLVSMKRTSMAPSA